MEWSFFEEPHETGCRTPEFSGCVPGLGNLAWFRVREFGECGFELSVQDLRWQSGLRACFQQQYLEGHQDIVSRFIIPISHLITAMIPLIRLSLYDPPSKQP